VTVDPLAFSGPEGPTQEDPAAALPPLLSSNDYDAYTAGDIDWYAAIVGSMLRDVCRWHIWPNITVTNLLLTVNPDGVIMVPTMLLTAVSDVTVVTQIYGTYATYDLGGPSGGLYQWNPNGYIKILQPFDITETPQTQIDWTPPPIQQAYVSFQHGYAAIPDAVKLIVSVGVRVPPAISDPETFTTDGTVESSSVKLPLLTSA